MEEQIHILEGRQQAVRYGKVADGMLNRHSVQQHGAAIGAVKGAHLDAQVAKLPAQVRPDETRGTGYQGYHAGRISMTVAVPWPTPTHRAAIP